MGGAATVSRSAKEVIAHRHTVRRKANPKLMLDGENRTVVFEDRPKVRFSPAALLALKDNAVLKDGMYETTLVAVEILDGNAIVHFGKDMS